MSTETGRAGLPGTQVGRGGGRADGASRGPRRWTVGLAVAALAAGSLVPVLASSAQAHARGCGALRGLDIPADAIGLPTTGAEVASATLVPAQEGVPRHCDVRVVIRPVDPEAPVINARVNFPVTWNGKAMHFGGGGYNGTVPAATGPAPSAPPGVATPLARGYVTFAGDSGHSGGDASFALNEEALVNYGFAALKKTRDVAVALIEERYGSEPAYTYFVGSSTGGREGLTVAQRFPDDYDGVLSRVPVVPFTALQLAGNRASTAIAAGGWMSPAEVRLLTDTTMAECDPLDGVRDGLVADYTACELDPAVLLCPESVDPAAGETCLSPAQVEAVRTLRSDLELEFPLANGVTSYPGWPAGHEAASWLFWVMGEAPPPAVQGPGTTPGGAAIANFGAQWVRYAITQDPDFDTRAFDPNDLRWRERIQEVSAIVDSTDPDLSAFADRGGKLIVQEFFGDYAQSAFAGAAYFESVVETLGVEETAEFARLYAAPGADHGGLGAPSQVDWVGLLEAWVEHGVAPRDVVMTGAVGGVERSLPACEYPSWPRYTRGPVEDADSFVCSVSRGSRSRDEGADEARQSREPQGPRPDPAAL